MTPESELHTLINRLLRIVLPRDRVDEILTELEESHRGRLGRMQRWRAGLHLWWECAGLVAWRLNDVLRRVVTSSGPSSLTLDGRMSMGWEFTQDLRFAFRGLARRPGFSLTVVAVLALGVGAPTTIFSLVDAVFLRGPEHVTEPRRLVQLHGVTGAERRIRHLERPEFVHFREAAATVSGLAAYGGPAITTYALDNGDVQQFALGFVSSEYFDVLGTDMELGREFRTEEDLEPGAHSLLVVSHGFWTRGLGADPAVVGRGLQINGISFTVIGVAPEGFAGVSPVEAAPDAWAPVAMYGAVTRAPDRAWWERVPGLEVSWLRVIGRLAEGVTFEVARTEVESLAEGMPRETDDADNTLSPSVRYSPEQQTTLSNLTQILLGGVGIVSLVAVANAALLLLTWSSARMQELAVRRALGASPARIARQLLTESSVLAAVGGAVGVLLSLKLSGFAGDLLPFRFFTSFRPQWPVIAAALALSALTAVLAGLAPALRAGRVDPGQSLGSGRRVSSGAGLRNGLVVAQVALSVMLVSGALLFTGSFWTARNQPLGFETENRLALLVDMGSRGYEPEDGRALIRRSLERIRALPGVHAASTGFGVPFRGGWSTNLPVDPTGPAEGETFRAALNVVSTDYFRVWGTALTWGRGIAPEDAGSGMISVVVNQTLADKYWPSEDVIGKVIDRGYDELRVVGVAQDAVTRGLGEATVPQVYMSLDQRWMPQTHLVLHTDFEALGMSPVVQSVLREIDPGLTFPWVGTMDSVLDEQTARYEVSALLVSAFGLAALILAAAGLYGVMGFVVNSRTREIGVRIALGASVRDILGRVLKSAAHLVLVGVAFGIVGFVALRRFVEGLVFGVSAANPLPPLLAVLILAAVGLVAALGPALRASRIEPREAIGAE